MCFGIGRCRITPSTLASSFIARNRALHSSCVKRRWPGLILERNADLLRRARLAANVDTDLLVLADADRDEPAERALRGAGVHACGDAVEYAIADDSAVQKAIIDHAGNSSFFLIESIARARVAAAQTRREPALAIR
jgi:hypothetical protein